VTTEETSQTPKPPSAPAKTPGIVIAALVLSIFGLTGITAIVGVILGFIGRRKAKQAGKGVGMATAAIAIGAAWLVLLAYGALLPDSSETSNETAIQEVVEEAVEDLEADVEEAVEGLEAEVTKRGGLSKTGFERLSLMKNDIDDFLTAIQSDDALTAVSMCSAMSSDYNNYFRLLSSTSPEYEEKISGMGGILDNFYSGMKDCEDAFGGDGLDIEALASSIASFQGARSMLVSMVASAKSQK